MKNPLLSSVFLLAALFCLGQSGTINITSVQQRSDGSGFVDVTYNLGNACSKTHYDYKVNQSNHTCEH
jgi:hypothetical protein